MVRAGHSAYWNLVLKMLQDASKARAEFRLVLPTLSHDIPGEKQKFMAVKNPSSWTTLHIHTGLGQSLGGSICHLPTTKSRVTRVGHVTHLQSSTPEDLRHEGETE